MNNGYNGYSGYSGYSGYNKPPVTSTVTSTSASFSQSNARNDSATNNFNSYGGYNPAAAAASSSANSSHQSTPRNSSTANNFNSYGGYNPEATSTSTSSSQMGKRNSRLENIPPKIFPDNTVKNIAIKLCEVMKKVNDPGPVDVNAIHFEMLQVYGGELRKMKDIYDRHKNSQK